MLILLAIWAVLIPISYILVTLGVKKSFVQSSEGLDHFPFVSIIISVRNESENIKNLCDSLSKLSYPLSDFEILIGDDSSDDDTFSLLLENRPANALVLSMSEDHGSVSGKHHVLSKLTSLAVGEYFLFTDADMSFPSDWVQCMIYNKSSKPTMMLGLTSVRTESAFGYLQDIDWRLNSLLISWVNYYSHAVTAWGNNMMIDKTSFEQVGGFDNIKNTIVEDFSLMQKLVASGGQVLIKASPNAMAMTNPETDFKALIMQRMRWLTVSSHWSWFIYLMIAIRMLFLPIVVFISFYSIWWVLLIPFKALVSLILIRQSQTYTRLSRQFIYLLIFEFYEFTVYLVTFVISLISNHISWKGRKYYTK